jgi:glycosyltransferase involved in cell wall biosynthesis
MTTDAVGGVWTYALDLAAGLGGRGVETILAVLGPSPTDAQRRAAVANPALTLVETGAALDWLATSPSEIHAAAETIRRLAKHTSADLIHLNSPALAIDGGYGAPVVGVCHSCLATWWGAVKDEPMPGDFRWRSCLLAQALTDCDMLLAPTGGFASMVGRTYDIRAPRVVHNGRRAREGRGRPHRRRPVVFTSGRLWDEGKNVAVLDAAAGLCGAPMFAAGPLEGPGGRNRIRLAHARSLGGLTEHEVTCWAGNASLYASAALYEPFGLGVLEAAQAGCALVLSDIPTFRELWDGAALFVEATSARAYADAFETLLGDEARARRLGALAMSRADRFSVAAMTEGVLAAYAELIEFRSALSRAEAAA